MSSAAPSVQLRKPLERAIARGHPWIYRDALRPFEAAPGSPVTVLDRRGRFLARGLAERGAIGVRVWTTRDEPVDAALIALRLEASMTRRDALALRETDALRLVHGEGDQLPGLVLDRYADHAALKLDGAAIAAWRATLVDLLTPLLAARGVEVLLERSGRGAGKQTRALLGALPTDPVEVREHGMLLLADLCQGQKTGLFLDHRGSRRRVRELAEGRSVLNLFGYTGAFSVAAGLGGATRVVTVDSARPAIAAAQQNWELNGLPAERHRGVSEPCERFLDRERQRFDLVISDPPSFAPNKRSLPKALAAYRALHRSAIARVTPGGLLLAASCSSHVSARAFEQNLEQAARAARCRLEPVDRWGAAADHPVLPAFPEGAYLKVVLARVHLSQGGRKRPS